MNWIEILVTLATSIIASGGIGAILFYSVNKKLKNVEVQDKQVDVLKKQDDEWQELYNELKDRVKEARQECLRLRTLKEEIDKKASRLELENQQLEWFRCTVNNCRNRRPPHVYDTDGNELTFPAQ